jgi:hypothetical protein
MAQMGMQVFRNIECDILAVSSPPLRPGWLRAA